MYLLQVGGKEFFATEKEFLLNNGDGQYWTRTSDILLVRQALYQLS